MGRSRGQRVDRAERKRRAQLRHEFGDNAVGFDDQGVPVDAKGNQAFPLLPIHTYLVNAGLSLADAVRTADELRLRVRRRIIQLAEATKENEVERLRYFVDVNYRRQLNQDLLREELLGMGFGVEELRIIDQGAHLGLAPPDPKPPVARVRGPSAAFTRSGSSWYPSSAEVGIRTGRPPATRMKFG